MKHDNKEKGKPTQGNEPPLKNYQEQPQANNELEAAINNIPVKDYSDYEITIETKDQYEDALFADDESLDQALTSPQKAINDQPEKRSTTALDEPKSISIDYSIFLSEQSRSGNFSISNNAPSSKQLKLTEASLNGSISTEKTPVTNIDRSHSTAQTEATTNNPTDERNNTESGNKLLHWGKQRLNKNKAQIDEYLGRSLPERLLPLEFKFSVLKPKKDFEHVISSYDIDKQLTTKGRLLHTLLKQADEDLAIVVKCQLSNKARLQILESYTPALFVKIRGIKGTQGKTPPYPYEEKRAIAGEHAPNVIKHLITLYKQVYSSLYESANHLYAPQRKTANRIAFKILDLLCLEQNLLNALHKPVPPGSPKTFNKIFHALARYEPQTIELAQPSLALEQEITIKGLFIRYQTLLSFDLMSLSSTLHKLLNQYLSINQGKLELLSSSDWNTPPSFSGKAWMVTHDNNKPPVLASAAGSDRFTAAFIRIDDFFNQIKFDYAQCLKLIGQDHPIHSSPALKTVAIQHSLTLMCELNRYVNMIESQNEPQSYTSFQPWPLKVYSGYAASYGWLDHYYAQLNQLPRKKGEAAAPLPKKPAAGNTEWQCAMEDDSTLYLKTTERKGTPPMDVGWLLLMLRSNEDNEDEVLLGRITRIERSQPGSLMLVVEKIGRQSTSVIVNQQSDNKSPGIISCHGDRHFLIANHAQSFWTGQTFNALLPNRSQTIMKVKGLTCLSGQLQVLELE